MISQTVVARDLNSDYAILQSSMDRLRSFYSGHSSTLSPLAIAQLIAVERALQQVRQHSTDQLARLEDSLAGMERDIETFRARVPADFIPAPAKTYVSAWAGNE